MQALILTGGLGSRLRPFTLAVPKPLLTVVNRPFIHYQLAALRSHGIRDVILATAYRPEQFRRALGNGRRMGLTIRYVHESTPLGTGGAVRNALPRPEGTTLVLNGDVLQALDIPRLMRTHRRARAEVTLTLTPVKDPSRYGLVETDGSGRILRFLEKPSADEITCDTINAGAYLFEPSAVGLIPKGRAYSLERELFPRMLELGRPMSAVTMRGYWLDFGTVEKYLKLHLDILGGSAPFLPPGLRRRGPFLAEPGTRLGPGAGHSGPGRVALGRSIRIGPGVRFTGSNSLGDRCVVQRNAALDGCVVLAGARIGAYARLTGCVIGRDCLIGDNATIGAGRALGDGSVVKAYSNI